MNGRTGVTGILLGSRAVGGRGGGQPAAARLAASILHKYHLSGFVHEAGAEGFGKELIKQELVYGAHNRVLICTDTEDFWVKLLR